MARFFFDLLTHDRIEPFGHLSPEASIIGATLRDEEMIAQNSDLIPKPALARELGVSSRTVSRWMADPALAFPPPIRLRNRLYFARSALEAWKNARVRASILEAAE